MPVRTGARGQRVQPLVTSVKSRGKKPKKEEVGISFKVEAELKRRWDSYLAECGVQQRSAIVYLMDWVVVNRFEFPRGEA